MARPARAAELPDHDLNPRQDTPLDFPAREFGELSTADYGELGFLCGLEVHQQLQTRSKLFCRCPAYRNSRSLRSGIEVVCRASGVRDSDSGPKGRI